MADVVVTVLDHLDEQAEWVATALERLGGAASEPGRVFGQCRQALPPAPTFETSSCRGLKWRQDFRKLSLELACLLPLSEEEMRV